MWGSRVFLHRENAGFSPLDKVGAPSSNQRGSVAALFFFSIKADNASSKKPSSIVEK